MFPLQPGDSLHRINTFLLGRRDLALTIEVHFCLRGENEGHYEACIIHKDGHYISSDFWATGSSEVEALWNCLNNIKHLQIPEIYGSD